MCKHWIKSSEVVLDDSKKGDMHFSVCENPCFIHSV